MGVEVRSTQQRVLAYLHSREDLTRNCKWHPPGLPLDNIADMTGVGRGVAIKTLREMVATGVLEVSDDRGRKCYRPVIAPLTDIC